jgi:hypothetical protein
MTVSYLSNGLWSRQVIRAMYSSPPRHGAEIAELVLSDPQLFRDWKVCLLAMFMAPLLNVLFLVLQFILQAEASGWLSDAVKLHSIWDAPKHVLSQPP